MSGRVLRWGIKGFGVVGGSWFWGFGPVRFTVLDKLILKTVLPPLLGTIFIADVVLIFQFVWKYVDELVGKDLPVLLVLKLLGYAGLGMLPLAIPIGLLLAMIMGYGQLAERLEWMALKASGISPVQAMRPAVVLGVVSAVGLLWYADWGLPWVNRAFYAQLYTIRQKQPVLLLTEGAFTMLVDRYAVYVRDMVPVGRDTYRLRHIVVYETEGNVVRLVLLAPVGQLISHSGYGMVTFRLEDGALYYSGFSRSWDVRHGLLAILFRRWEKTFFLERERFSELFERMLRSHHEMLNFHQLRRVGDSLRSVGYGLWRRRLDQWRVFFPYADTVSGQGLGVGGRVARGQFRSLGVEDLLPAERERFRTFLSTLKHLTFLQARLKENYLWLGRRYFVTYHKRMAFAVACVVLVVWGVCLGAILRRGGLGLPLVASGITFTLYHVVYMLGEQMAREGMVPVVVGAWLANWVFGLGLVPLVVFVQRDTLKLLRLPRWLRWLR